MVDVVRRAVALHQVQQIVDIGDHVLRGEGAVVVGQIAVVADDLHFRAVILFGEQLHEAFAAVDAAFVDLPERFFIEERMRFDDHFARFRIDDRFRRGESSEAVLPAELLPCLVAADLGQIVSVRIVEEIVQQRRGAFHRRRFARAQLLVDFDQRFIRIVGRVLFQRSLDVHILREEIEDVLIGGPAQRADEDRSRHLAVPVDADGHGAVGVGFQFDPGAAVRDHLAAVDVFPQIVLLTAEIYARRTDQLGDDDTFRPVDDEGARGRHDREIAHEKIIIFLDFPGLAVDELYLHLQRCAVRHCLGTAVVDGVFLRAEIIVLEVQRPLVAAVLDRRDIVQYIPKSFLLKPFIGFRLEVEQMRHLQYFFRSCIRVSFPRPCLFGSEHSAPHPFVVIKPFVNSPQKSRAQNEARPYLTTLPKPVPHGEIPAPEPECTKK